MHFGIPLRFRSPSRAAAFALMLAFALTSSPVAWAGVLDAVLESCLSSFRKLPRDPELSKAILALPKSDERKAAELLYLDALDRERGLRDPKLQLRLRALRKLEEIGKISTGRGNGPEFIKTAKGFDRLDQAGKLQWIEQFGKSRNPSAPGVLRWLLSRDGDVKVRRGLRRALIDRGEMKNHEVFLEDYLRDLRENRLRPEEIDTLPGALLLKLANRPEAFDRRPLLDDLNDRPLWVLARAMGTENSKEVRERAIRALGQRFGRDAFEPLSNAAADVDPVVRLEARQALGARVGDPRARERLAELGEAHAVEEMDQAGNRARSNLALVEQKGNGIISDEEFVDRVSSLLNGVSAKRAKDFFKGLNESGILSRAPEVWVALFKRIRAPQMRRELADLRLTTYNELLNRQEAYDFARIVARDPVGELRLVGLTYLLRNGRRKEALELAARESAVKVRQGIAALLRNERDVESYQNFRALRNLYDKPPIAERDLQALAAADHVYDAPEYDLVRRKPDPVESLVSSYQAFRDSAPPGYAVARVTSDPVSGFKAAVYMPVASPRDPVIVSFGGSQTWVDWKGDVNMGMLQARSLAYGRLVESVAKMIESNSHLLPKNFLITGHSLGGGVAQMFGHDLLHRLMPAAKSPKIDAKVRVVTFNGFGAQEPLARLGRFEPRIAEMIARSSGDDERWVNYFIPRDPVSRVGTHLGTTMALPNVGFWRIIGAHLLGTIRGVTDAMPTGVAPLPMRPTDWNALSAVSSKVGPEVDRRIVERFRDRAPEALNTIQQARVRLIETEGISAPGDYSDWLVDEIDSARAASRPDAKGALPELWSERKIQELLPRLESWSEPTTVSVAAPH